MCLLQHFASVREKRDGSYTMDPAAFPTMTAEQLEAKRRRDLKIVADARRDKLMMHMSKMQKMFIKGNKKMWDQTNTDLEPPGEEECTGYVIQGSHHVC